jgi:hypothetical protein
MIQVKPCMPGSGVCRRPYQDKGHGKTTERLTMTFFYWCAGVPGDQLLK